MAGYARRGEIDRHLESTDEDIRRLKLRGKGAFTVSQTFIIGGRIAPSLYIPQHIIGMDRWNAAGLDGAERKFLVDVRHRLETGTATIVWHVNGTDTFAAGDDEFELFDDDRLRPEITAASATAEHLSATFTIAYFPG